MSERLESRSLSHVSSDKFKLDFFARQEEKKKLQVEKKNFYLEFVLDLVDVGVKLAVFLNFMINGNVTCTAEALAADPSCKETAHHTGGIGALLGIAFLFTLVFGTIRLLNMYDMSFVAEHGYSKRWKVQERIHGGEKGKDPRIQRDADARVLQHFIFRTTQAFAADLPWIFFNVYRIHQGLPELLDLTSVCVAGFGFGMKFSAFLNLIKGIFFAGQQIKRKDVYQILPADVKCGVGASIKDDSVEAIEEAYTQAAGQVGGSPTFIYISMTATHDHAAGLGKIRELARGIPYTGCTTCQGVLIGTRSERTNHKVVGAWVMSDPEGDVECYNYELGDDPLKSSENAGKAAYQNFTKRRDSNNPVTRGKPSFVWMHSAPGPEDLVLVGLSKVFGNEVPIVGGSSADNDISGSWKQWSSYGGGKLTGAGCSISLCYVSAMVQGQLFTGYNATGKTGMATKCDGLRHILEIDNRPAIEVYNEWTGGAYNEFLKDPEDSIILGPSSLFPLGQVCGEDQDGEPFLRSMHPHLIKKATKSLTLFSDVKEGETLVMMAGTKENLVNRIAGVATHIVRTSGFTLQEVRGALLVFCAGCMMYASDSMDLAAGKVSEALGGTPYIGVHTFGEQGQFPDGMNRHGNLMFSCLIISSRRRVIKLLNVDTGKQVNEMDPGFEEIVASGAVA